MPEPTDGVDEPQGDAHHQRTGDAAVPGGETALIGRIPRLGIWAWSFVGLVVATVIVVAALAAVSEIVLPLTFAAVLAVIFKPLAGVLERHRVKPGLAAGLVVLGLLAVATGAVLATVRGVTGQLDQIGPSVDAALDNAATALGIDQGTLDAARAATEQAARAVTGGFLTRLVSGVGSLVGLASGVILGALIM
jgi:predicted PurR-regulated permease PerM